MSLTLLIVALMQAPPGCGSLTIWSWSTTRVFRCSEIDPRDGMPAPGACCCSDTLIDHCMAPGVAGPDRPAPPECAGLDLNRDWRVDLDDVATLQLTIVP